MDERRAIKTLLRPRGALEVPIWLPWPKEELRKFAETDDLHISPFREDGKTYGR